MPCQLFALVLNHHVLKLDYAILAKHMGVGKFPPPPLRPRGSPLFPPSIKTLLGVTPNAISLHISKIKERAKKYKQSLANDDDAVAGSGSVSKRGKRTKKVETTSSRRKTLKSGAGGSSAGRASGGASGGAGRRLGVLAAGLGVGGEYWENDTPSYGPHKVGAAGDIPEEYAEASLTAGDGGGGRVGIAMVTDAEGMGGGEKDIGLGERPWFE